MSSSPEHQRLLDVLEERGIPLTGDDISWAFESTQTKSDVEAWVNEYLGHVTLLSKEELDLSRRISRRQITQADATDPCKVSSLTDEELREALKSLQESTTAVERQCRNLEIQKEAIYALRQSSKSNPSAERALAERKRRQTDEKAQLRIDIEDATTSATHMLHSTFKDLETSIQPLTNDVADQLSSDDRTMTRISKVLQILQSNAADEQDSAKVQTWGESLARMREAELKARIDTTFAKSLTSPSTPASLNLSAEDAKSEKQALQDELRALRSEVESVVEMVVVHELLEPMSKHKKQVLDSKSGSQQSWLQYVISSFEFMVHRLDTSTSNLDHLAAFKDALHQLDEAFQREQPVPEEAVTKSHRRSSSFPLNANFLPKQATQVPGTIARVLQHLDIHLERRNGKGASMALSQAAHHRMDHAHQHLSSTESNVSQSAGEATATAIAEAGRLLEALHVNSRYGSISLNDVASSGRLQKLEAGMATVGQQMAEAESNRLTLDEDHSAKFTAQWATKH